MKHLLLFSVLLGSCCLHAQTFSQACTGSAAATVASCSPASNVTSGHLLIVNSKNGNNTLTTPTISSTGPCSGHWIVITTQLLPSGSQFEKTMGYCNIPSTAAETVTVTWTGGSATFTDIEVAEYAAAATHTWVSPALDNFAVDVNATLNTPCPSGTTTISRSLNELVVFTCDTFNFAQTWANTGGYTNEATASRNTAGWFDLGVTTTRGAQANTLTLGTGDSHISIIATFKESGPATYYISKSAGTNAATATAAQSQSTPWASLPGMASCSSNCATYTPVADDIFIQKGCDTWVAADFPITWNWSGSSGHRISITVDQTWFNTTTCPSQWNRPIYNAASNQAVTSFFENNGQHDFTVSWIECTGMSNNGGGAGNTTCADIGGGQPNITLDHWYIHNWHHTGASGGNDNFFAFFGGFPIGCNVLADHNVFDGSDSDGGGNAGAFHFEWGSDTYNVVHDAPNALYNFQGCTGGTTEIAYNNVYNIGLSTFFSGVHENGMESANCGSGSCRMLIHDNVENNVQGETMMVGNGGETDYIWNNVIYNGWEFNEPQNTVPGAALYIWNNSVNAQTSRGSCFQGASSPNWPIIKWQNNHCVSDAGLGSGGGGTCTSCTNTNNLVVTIAAGALQGFTQAETYVYSPVSSTCNGHVTNCTVGTGINLTGQAWLPLEFIAQDTTYPCKQSTINSVVQVDCSGQRTPNARPSSGAWDVGAFEFAAGSPTITPAPAAGMFARLAPWELF